MPASPFARAASRFGALLTAVTLLLAAGAPAVARAQATTTTGAKALVYCPVGVDVAGCDQIVTALTGTTAFPGGVVRAYDGTSGTVDLAYVTLSQYAVLVVPSLADDSTHAPYAVLRTAAVQSHLKAGVTGRVAVWAGTPDLGSDATLRPSKDQLLRNLASWAATDWSVAGTTGLVVLADLSADAARRYDWLAGVSRLVVTADPELYGFDAATPLTGTGKEILRSSSSSTTPLAYANMASFGLLLPDGATVGTADATGVADSSGTNVVRTLLVTAPGGGNTGAATIKTTKPDYSPGDTAVFVGGGWAAGETVSINLHENPLEHADRTFTSVADADGNFRNTDLVLEPHHLGVTFYVTAKGGTSGLVAQTTFTDGNVNVKTNTNGILFDLSYNFYSGRTDCTGPSTSGTQLGVGATGGTSFSMNVNSGQSIRLTAEATANTGETFSSWSTGQTTLSICVAGSGSTQNITANYTSTAATALAVSPASGTFGGTAALSATLTAGGSGVSGKTIAFTLNGASAGSATTNASGVATIPAASLAGINAGSYPTGVGASFAGDAGFTASSGTAALTVGKANQTVTFTPPTGLKFGDADATLTATATSGLPVSFSTSTPAVCTIVSGKLHIVAAGSCTVIASQAGDANYNAAPNVPQTTTIGARAVVITPNAGQFKVFGTADPTLTFTNDGGLVAADFGTTKLGRAAGENVGTYAINIGDLSAGPNYSLSLAPTTVNFEIKPLSVAITLAGLTGQTYDGSPKTATVTASPTSAAIEAALVKTYKQGAVVVADPTNAGSYDLTVTSNSTNYTLTGATTGTLVISQVTPTVEVTWAGGPYTGSPYDATAAVKAGGTLVSGAFATLTFYAGGTAAGAPLGGVPTNAGTYTVRASFAGNTNYAAAYTDATITITQVTPTVEVTWAGGPYTGSPYDATAAVKAGGTLVSGALATLTFYAGPTAAGAPLGGVPTDAGTYTVRASFAGNTNYAAAYTDATITITQVTPIVEVTWAGGPYTGSPYDATAAVKAGGTLVSGAFATLTFYAGGTAAGAPLGGVPTNAGTYTVRASFAGNTNYAAAYTDATITITQRPLTITADDKSKDYDGAAFTAFTASYDGLIAADADAQGRPKAGVLSSPVVFGGTAAGAVDAGTYSIVPSGAVAGNYAISFANGALEIRKVAPTIAVTGFSGSYDGNAHAGSCSATGVGGSAVPATTTYAPGGAAPTNAGTYTLTCAVSGQTNYSDASRTATIQIDKAAATIVVNGFTGTYDGGAHGATGTATGVKSEDLSGLLHLGASFTNVPGGTAHWTFDGNTNYNTASGNAEIAIGAKALTASITAAGKTYDGTTAVTGAVGCSVATKVGSDDVDCAASNAAFNSADAGARTVTANVVLTGAAKDNYTLGSQTTASVGAEIAKKELTITASSPSSIEYGSDVPSVTPNFSGFVSGQSNTTALTTQPTCTTTYTVGSAVGSYPTGCSGAVAANYEPTYVAGTFAVTPATGIFSELSAPEITFGDATATVSGKLLSKFGSLPATGQISVTIGAVGGALTGTATLDGHGAFSAVINTSGLHANLTGYPVAIAYAATTNFQAASDNSLTLVVKKADQTVTFAALANKTYGDAPFTVSGTASSGLGLTFSVGATDKCTISGSTVTITGAGSCTVTAAQAGNGDFNPATSVARTFTIARATPVITWPTPASVPQGTALSGTQLNATAAGVGGITPLPGTFVYAPPAGTVVVNVGTTTLGTTFSPTDAANYNSQTASVSLAVTNVAPVVTLITLNATPVPINTSVPVTATFTDPGTSDVHTATIGWDDGSSSAGTVNEAGRTVSGSHVFTSAGVYTVTVTVADNNGGSGSRSSSVETIAYIVVYDPSAGFVTGGGWINSPANACRLSTCAADGSTTGKATFGFNAKYQKGANQPDGSTEFQFQAGGLNFKSTTYSWLVVAGTKAQYKGAGTVNGRTGYTFLLTAIDGDSKSNPDAFRMKIMDASGTVVYDNQMMQPDDSDLATTLGGGSIVIHQ